MGFDSWAFDSVLTDDVIVHYLDVLRGDALYDGSDERIVRFEDFLFQWLNRGYFPDKELAMVRLSELALKDYSFTGEAYRGISLLLGKEITYGYVTSFSSSDLVAEYFGSGDEEYYKGYLFSRTGEMFDLSALMADVRKWTPRTDLVGTIDRNMWEEEKIAYFDESCEDLSEHYVFNEWDGLYD